MLGQPLGRLIEDQHARLEGERHRHLEQAPVAVGERPGAAIARRLEADRGECGIDPLPHLGLVDAQARRLGAAPQVVDRGLGRGAGKTSGCALVHVAVNIGVETQTIAHRAAKKRMHRRAQILAQNVPQGLLQPAQRGVPDPPPVFLAQVLADAGDL